MADDVLFHTRYASKSLRPPQDAGPDVPEAGVGHAPVAWTSSAAYESISPQESLEVEQLEPIDEGSLEQSQARSTEPQGLGGLGAAPTSEIHIASEEPVREELEDAEPTAVEDFNLSDVSVSSLLE